MHIPTTGLNAIKISDNQPVRVGDVVPKIENPLNVGQTVAMGIIGETVRNRIGMYTFRNFIQTDIAINPGDIFEVTILRGSLHLNFSMRATERPLSILPVA